MVLLPTVDLMDIETIGIPRGLLFYRYGVQWCTFFEALGRSVVISPETDKAIVERGTEVSSDECCLASKTYLGHVDSLIGSCDAIFVPCYASVDPRAGFCTKFQSATDLVRNTFRDQHVRVISFLIEKLTHKKEVQQAYVNLGLRLGASPSEAHKAYKLGFAAQEEVNAKNAANQEELLKLIQSLRRLLAKHPDIDQESPLVILVVAHPYIAHDPYLGGPVIEALAKQGAYIVYADETRHEKTFKASFDFSDTMPWVVNRELIGSILLLQDKIDGIVLLSAFPCGPDSMTDDAIMRCITGKPILNLMIDAQSGTAGIETRVESFIDILRYQQKGGYVHD